MKEQQQQSKLSSGNVAYKGGNGLQLSPYYLLFLPHFSPVSSSKQRTKVTLRTSLAVQWVRFRAPNAGGLGSIPGQGTRSRMHASTMSLDATTKSLHVATKKSAHRN